MDQIRVNLISLLPVVYYWKTIEKGNYPFERVSDLLTNADLGIGTKLIVPAGVQSDLKR